MITEGGIDRSIDRLVEEYDRIKNRYEMDWSMAVQHGNGKVGKLATVSGMDEFIGRCEELHGKVIAIQDQAMEYVERMVKDVALRVSQAVVFKIQEMGFSMKRLMEGVGREEKELGSPERRARMKSANSEVKSKSVIEN